MRRTLWISLKRLKIHEFDTTLRRLGPPENTWVRKFEILQELESDAIKTALKTFGTLLLSYLMLTSLKSEGTLSFTIQTFTASVPLSYFLASVSLLFLVSILIFCHLSVAMSMKAKQSGKKLVSGFSSSVFGLISGRKDDSSLGIPMSSNYFIKEMMPVSGFLSTIALLCILISVVPIFAYGILIGIEAYSLALTEDLSVLDRLVAFISMLVISFSIIYFVLFHVPLPTRKNTEQLRWSFLWPLRNDHLHPMADRWLDK